MNQEAVSLLKVGRKFTDPIMEAHGFHWEPRGAGKSSGGFSDSGVYVKGDRKLELHFRFSLGLVNYHIGSISLSHEEYMRHVAGKGQAQYPGFSDDPMGGSKHLADDLAKYGGDFLSGSGDEFKEAVTAAKERDKLSGFQKLSSN
jgi:hypothetical protein